MPEPTLHIPTKPPLKSLEEHNAEKRAIFDASYAACPNGLACPKCGEELLDSHPMAGPIGIPPRMNVHCYACDFSGERLA